MGSSSSKLVLPAIPYVCQIPGGVINGLEVTVHGKVPHQHNSFQIDFSTGPNIEPKSDSVLTFNPRFGTETVVLSTQSDGVWENEEQTSTFPFSRGVPFELIFKVKHDVFKIYFNGIHFTDYKHRIPKESAKYLLIMGGVEISLIKFDVNFAYPDAKLKLPSPAEFIINPHVPFLEQIPGEVDGNQVIAISGVPTTNPARFVVYLQLGPESIDDICFMFDVRFDFCNKTNVTVRNNRLSGTWDIDEIHASSFPFRPNEPFDIAIMIDHNHYKVAVNNQPFCQYKHIIHPPTKMKWLYVTGDVKLTSVYIN